MIVVSPGFGIQIDELWSIWLVTLVGQEDCHLVGRLLLVCDCYLGNRYFTGLPPLSTLLMVPV